MELPDEDYRQIDDRLLSWEEPDKAARSERPESRAILGRISAPLVG